MSRSLGILVAEDNEDDRFLVERAFRKAGFKAGVSFVDDGREAVEYLKGEPPFTDRAAHPLPSLLLLDLKMPRFDGFDVIEWVRRQPALRRLIILVLSNSDLPEDINRAYDLGANSYLVKGTWPAEMEGLARQLESYWLTLNHCPDC